MRRMWTCALAITAAVLAPAIPASADEVDVLIDKLVEKGHLTPSEAEEVRSEIGAGARQREEEQRALLEEASKEIVPRWTQSLTWSGDLRLRHEAFWREDAPDRNRERIRLRAGVKAKVAAPLELGARFATGAPLDPISTNQTLTHVFDKKPVFIDQAYARYSTASLPARPRVPVTVVAGKFEIPFAYGSLVWDGDVTMEGIAAGITPRTGRIEWSLLGGAFPVEEISNGEDPTLVAGQLGAAWAAATQDGSHAPLKLRAAAAYYDFVNLDEGLPTAGGDSFGNSAMTNGEGTTSFLARDFDELDLMAEISSSLLAEPFRVFAEYVRNTSPGGDDEGYQVGARWGRTDEPLDVEIGAFYQRLEADAVLGRFTDSDFGTGGTDQEGVVGWITVGTLKNSTIGVRWSSTDAIEGDRGHLDRATFDWITKF